MHFHLIWTLVLVVIFFGIFLWAWSDHKRQDFIASSRIPLDDERSKSKLKQEAING